MDPSGAIEKRGRTRAMHDGCTLGLHDSCMAFGRAGDHIAAMPSGVTRSSRSVTWWGMFW